MKRKLIPILASTALAFTLTGCDGVIGVAQTHADAAQESAAATHAEAEAQRLLSEAQRLQAQTDAETARALVATANARADDLRLIIAMAFIVAAASLGMSIAVFMWARNLARQQQPAQVVYQVTAPPAPVAQLGAAQVTPFQMFLQERAQQRALQAARWESKT